MERLHHSYDIFPDSDRVLPFSSWATIFYNYVDLKIKNTLDYPIQIKLWLDNKYLKWQILSDFEKHQKIHILEDSHSFIHYNKKFFRYNIISKETKINWKLIKKEKIIENFAPVLYNIDFEYIKKKNYNLKF